MFMEQCCQPDIIEDHDTKQSTTSENGEDDYEGPSRAYYESCAREHSDKKKKEAEDDKLYYEKETAHYEGYTLEHQARQEYYTEHSTWDDDGDGHSWDDDGDGAVDSGLVTQWVPVQ